MSNFKGVQICRSSAPGTEAVATPAAADQPGYNKIITSDFMLLDRIAKEIHCCGM
jgi:hypothetical protein